MSTSSTFGIRIDNPYGKLVLTNDGYGLNHVGQAQFVSTTPTIPGGRYGSGAYYHSGTKTGHHTYRVRAAGLVVPYVTMGCGLLTSEVLLVRLMDVRRVEPDWEFDVQPIVKRTGVLALHSEVAVLCFTRPQAVSGTGGTSGTSGLVILDEAGDLRWNLCGDLSNAGGLLAAKGHVVMDGGEVGDWVPSEITQATGAASPFMPANAHPAVCGDANGYIVSCFSLLAQDAITPNPQNPWPTPTWSRYRITTQARYGLWRNAGVIARAAMPGDNAGVTKSNLVFNPQISLGPAHISVIDAPRYL